MRLVADANVLFSAFLRSGATRRLWLDRRIELFAPRFILAEFEKHFSLLLDRTEVPPENALKFSEKLLSRLKLVEASELALFSDAAKHLTSDEKDEPYVACALAVGADRHLRGPRIKCWSTEGLLDEFFS